MRRSQGMRLWPTPILDAPPITDAQEAIEQLSATGYIAQPGDSLVALIQSLGRNTPRILLGEGVFAITKTLTISRATQLISFAPGRTIFQRTTGFLGPMISITADDVHLKGITFQDTSRTQTVIDLHGNHCNIDGCLFLDFKNAIHAYTSGTLIPSRVKIINNRFRGPGFDTAVVGGDGHNILDDAIQLDTGTTGLVSGNHFSEWLTGFSQDTRSVDSATAVTTSAFTSNVAYDSIIRYKGGVGSVDSGNVATVQVF